MFCAFCTLLGRQTDWGLTFHEVVCLTRRKTAYASAVNSAFGFRMANVGPSQLSAVLSVEQRSETGGSLHPLRLQWFVPRSAKNPLTLYPFPNRLSVCPHRCWQQSEHIDLGWNAVNQGLHRDSQEESTSESCSPPNSNASVQYEAGVSRECG